MPIGVALRDPREQLFAAAARVLARDGASGLTSRAITDEAGVAKGVLHRHFADLDDFVAQLVRAYAAGTGARAALADKPGTASVVANVSGALTRLFAPETLQVVALVTSRDRVRERLRATHPRGVPVLDEAVEAVGAYLDAERAAGRLRVDADPSALALALVGTGHLLFAGELGGLPDADAVHEVVESALVGALPGPPGAHG